MASRTPDIGERLREGIEAARRGDRVNARRLLQQVLILDRDNEAALMWMASVVDSLAERRAFLERALRVNPNNQRARDALERLGGSPPARTGGAPEPAVNTRRPETRRKGINPYLVAAIIVGVITVVVVGASLLSSRPTVDNDVANAESTLNAIIRPTGGLLTTVAPPVVATATPFIGVVVTIDPNAQFTLPATFTPTDTPLPTSTFTPTPTNVPSTAYDVIFAAFSPDLGTPGLYRSRGDGSRFETLGNPADGFSDVKFSYDGEWIAFVRDASVNDQPRSPQVFIAPLANLAEAAPITNFANMTVNSPAWSPDGQRLVFISAESGTPDVWIINRDGGGLRNLTSNSTPESSPSFSPDGMRILFASDMDSPGFAEIYEYDLQTSQTTRLTDEGGSNYAPAYSPDGSKIVFVSTQNGDSDLYIMDANGQRKFLLTVDDASAEDRAPVFTPDGASIVFLSTRAGRYQPYLYNLRSAEVTALTISENEVQSITFNPTITVPR